MVSMDRRERLLCSMSLSALAVSEQSQLFEFIPSKATSRSIPRVVEFSLPDEVKSRFPIKHFSSRAYFACGKLKPKRDNLFPVISCYLLL